MHKKKGLHICTGFLPLRASACILTPITGSATKRKTHFCCRLYVYDRTPIRIHDQFVICKNTEQHNKYKDKLFTQLKKHREKGTYTYVHLHIINRCIEDR